MERGAFLRFCNKMKKNETISPNWCKLAMRFSFWAISSSIVNWTSQANEEMLELASGGVAGINA